MNVSHPYISKVLRSDVNISFGTAPLIATPSGQPTAGGYAKLAHALEMDFFPELRAKQPEGLPKPIMSTDRCLRDECSAAEL